MARSGYPRRVRPGPRSPRLLLLLAGLLLFGACSRGPERIVLVTIDTLRADHVGCYGDAQARTPVIDGLAADGVRFEVALSPVPLTLPSHTSILTALDPPRHGVRHNSMYRLGAGPATLAERLRAQGFATAAFVGAVVLDPRFGLGRGFDTYDDATDPRRPGVIGFAERTADHVVDAALRWVDGAPPRFFLWVHLYDPHAPYLPPDDLLREFPGAPYRGEIAFADRELGRLLASLRARFGAGDTLVVVTSDHGESLGDHGELTHGYSLYDSTQRVPLVMAGPGVPKGVVVRDPARLIDVAPTVLGLAGAPPLDGVDGADLRPLIAGREKQPRRTYMETWATQLDYGWSPLYALRTDVSKLVDAPQPELYDLVDDPAEIHNLADARPADAAALRSEVEALAARSAPAAAPVELSEADRARLESLGYVVSSPVSVGPELGHVGGPDPKWERGLLARISEVGDLIAQDRVAEAHAALQRIHGGGPFVSAMRARAAIAAQDPEAALREVETLERYPGQQSVAAQTRAQALLMQQKLDEAEAAYEKALALEPTSPSLHQGLGQLAEARGDRARAMELYGRSVELDPSGIDVRWRLAALWIEDGRDPEAEALLEPLDARTLERPATAVRLAYAEVRVGRTDAAERRLEAAARAHPDSTLIATTRGHLLEKLGRPQEALVARETVLRLEPDSPGAQNDVAWNLALVGRDLDRALALAQRAAAADPNSSDILDTVAFVRLARGEPSDALRAIDRALVLRPSTEAAAHLYYQRALALDALGRRALAREALARALASPGSRPPSWWADAQVLATRLGVERPHGDLGGDSG